MKQYFSLDEAKQVGEELGCDWVKWSVEQFQRGMNIELEHGKSNPLTNITDDDPLKTGKIALIHLMELSDYYTRLDEMEDEGKVDKMIAEQKRRDIIKTTTKELADNDDSLDLGA
jgi:uncharacterized Fe-S cluster-containing radical SAM superfamily enzyme